jgi:hypothetical protein
MVIKKACPHTGVINFFVSANPYVAVGCISSAANPARYAWYCYLQDETSGSAADISSAELSLREAIATRRTPARQRIYLD